MRIPKTFFRTTWRADWLIEFSIALIALAFLTRETILAAVGVGISLALATLGFIFHRRIGILRRELEVEQHLSKTRVFLGDNIEGEVTIRNRSRLIIQILNAQPVLPRELSFRMSSSFNLVLQPGTTLSSGFAIMSPARGRFQITGFTLSFADPRGLFTGEVTYAQPVWIEVYPGIRTSAPLTPLRLYGGSTETFRASAIGTDYAGTREYTTGDEYHTVEWKATARLRKLMVKEFHPETQTTLRILINAGRTMRQRSYVGTRLDEALAIAQLLVESTVGSGTRVGILIYNETEIMRDLESPIAEEQLANSRDLASALQVQAIDGQPSSDIPRPTARLRPELPVRFSKRVVAFVKSLRPGLRDAGIYKALDEASRAGGEGTTIVLTDLQSNNDALVEAVIDQRERKVRTIVARIGAAWRIGDSLESAYLQYVRENRSLEILRRLGITVLDVRPERLFDTLVQEIRETATKPTAGGSSLSYSI